MKKIVYKLIILSIILGIIITLITGFFTHPSVVGAKWWGYPLTWKTQAVLSPEYSPPLNINWLNFIIDIIIWTIIFFIIFGIILRKKF